jgi:hypothetical protein
VAAFVANRPGQMGVIGKAEFGRQARQVGVPGLDGRADVRAA